MRGNFFDIVNTQGLHEITSLRAVWFENGKVRWNVLRLLRVLKYSVFCKLE